ncbi:hypothetical protein Cgig2_017209 [Carnegiea gigantea]|uniref:Uncharacterized protein n=1 Tax=Carnegiea gigantea TaxID=171969 RepID=A0A9Q1KFD1_9CARY|nr:hypothetical protein Cgig2_017209 [Carnegiea gigantea]
MKKPRYAVGSSLSLASSPNSSKGAVLPELSGSSSSDRNDDASGKALMSSSRHSSLESASSSLNSLPRSVALLSLSSLCSSLDASSSSDLLYLLLSASLPSGPSLSTPLLLLTGCLSSLLSARSALLFSLVSGLCNHRPAPGGCSIPLWRFIWWRKNPLMAARIGPVHIRSGLGPILGPHLGLFSVLGPTGPVLDR